MENRRWKYVRHLLAFGIAGASSFAMWNREEVLTLTALFVLNVLTFTFSRWTAEKIFRSAAIGMLGGLVYTWAPYRVYSARVSRDYGELAAWALLPLAGFVGYRLFSGTDTGWKKVLYCLLIPCMGMLLLNGYPLLRDGRSLLSGQYVLEDAFSLQGRGVYGVHYLMTFFRAGSSVEFGREGMMDSAPMGIGFPITAGVIAYIWLFFTDKVSEKTKEEKKKQMVFCNIMLLLGMVALVVSTNSFPWDNLRSHYKLYTVVTVLVQSPSRIMGIVMLCFWLASCMAVSLFGCWQRETVGRTTFPIS